MIFKYFNLFYPFKDTKYKKHIENSPNLLNGFLNLIEKVEKRFKKL